MIVFIYPGQGSQEAGMGAPWINHPSWELVTEASDISGIDVKRLLIDAQSDELKDTRNSQLATFVLSMVTLDAVERLGVDAAGHAGHSLGEYSALTASGALDFNDSVKLVCERSSAMADAILDSPGSMSAVIGLEEEVIEEICLNSQEEVWVANYNAPNQVVIAGEKSALQIVAKTIKSSGAKRVIPLEVAGAFHTPLMSSARERLAAAVDTVEIRSPEGVVVANVDATAHSNPDTWRALLNAQLCSPVKWRQTMATLSDDGFTTFVELGPGKVLNGLTKRCLPEMQRMSINNPDDLDSLLFALAVTTSEKEKVTHHEGEHLFATDRLVVSPNAGIFKPVTQIEIGKQVATGTLLGTINGIEVRSPFAGELLGWLAINEERVTASQPIAWLRATN